MSDTAPVMVIHCPFCQTDSPTTISDPVHCPHCQQQINLLNHYCPHCFAYEQTANSQCGQCLAPLTMACPHCQVAIWSGFSTCPYCAHSFTTTTTEAELVEKDENDEDVSLPPHLQKQMEEAVRFAALGGDDYAQQMMLMMRQEKARLAELKRQTEARTAQQKRARAFLLRILIVLLALTITYFFWEAL